MKSEWTSRPLGELVNFASGGTPSKRKGEYWIGDIPWISAKTLKSERITTSDLFITENGLNAGSKLAPCGSILLLTRGSGLFNGIPVGLVEKEVAFNQDIKCLNSCSEIENKFIFYWLLSQRNYLMAKVGVTGIGAGKFDLDFLQKLEVPIPSEQERHQIIAIGDALSDKIELNQKINENLERQAQMLFKFWFVDFVPFGGNVPDDWKYISFSEFLTPSSIKSDDPSLPMFSVTDSGIFPREEKFKKNLSMANTKSKVINQTDLVFGMSREILNWGIMRHLVGGVSSAYNVYQVDERINTFYLESYMKANSQYFKDLIRPASREGQGIDKNALMQKVLLMPPQTVLKQYYAIEDVLTQTADHALEENRRLAQIRDALIPKLMSGELDVSDIQR